MAFTWDATRILWKGLGTPRDDIWELTAWAIVAAPSKPLLDWLLE